jgi:hypothetical protein
MPGMTTAKKMLHEDIDAVFRRNHAHLSRAAQFYTLTQTAMMITAMTASKYIDVQEEVEKAAGVKLPKDAKISKEKVLEIGGRCVAQKQRDFPELCAMLAVTTWGSLEALVEDVVVALLMCEPARLNNACFDKISTPLAEYELLDLEGRMRFLYRELEKKNRSVDKLGVNGFETLLQHFGIQVSPNDEVKKQLIALSQIRNIIVHREHIVDRRLVEKCSWLGLKVGEKLELKRPEFESYFEASTAYSQGFHDKCVDVLGK